MADGMILPRQVLKQSTLGKSTGMEMTMIDGDDSRESKPMWVSEKDQGI